MKKLILASATVFAMTAFTSTAFAGGKCYVCGSTTQGASWDSGATGFADNVGQTIGDVGVVWSESAKDLNAGGVANEHGAHGWASANFGTSGGAISGSMGWGPQIAGTMEEGSVGSAGGASVTRFISIGR